MVKIINLVIFYLKKYFKENIIKASNIKLQTISFYFLFVIYLPIVVAVVIVVINK